MRYNDILWEKYDNLKEPYRFLSFIVILIMFIMGMRDIFQYKNVVTTLLITPMLILATLKLFYMFRK